MGKRSSSKSFSKNISNSNNGIAGSGIFGMFGSIVDCPASDDSVFCTIMKIFNIFIVIIVVIVILWCIYYFFIKRRR